MNTWHCSYAGIEKTGFQLSLIQQARREGISVREIEVDRDKTSRAMAATPLMEAGHVWFPAGAAFMGDFEHELLTFPQGDHDDMVDCLSAAVLQLSKAGGWSLLDWNPETVKPEYDDDDRRHPLDGYFPTGGNPFAEMLSGMKPPLWMRRPGEFYR
jgi:hypothetical protein